MSVRKTGLVAVIEEHGGIVVLVTHPVYPARGKGLQIHEEWQNTIICRDGYVRALSTKDEDDLKDLAPRHRAHHHLSVNERGVRIIGRE